MVVNGENMEEVISFHHRKEEISDIKFSPGKRFLQKTHLHVTIYLFSMSYFSLRQERTLGNTNKTQKSTMYFKIHLIK